MILLDLVTVIFFTTSLVKNIDVHFQIHIKKF